LLETIFAPFVEERPICVMARGTLERLLDAQRLDTLFARTAQQQYTRELLFSSLVQLMSEVVLGVHPTVHAAYQANKTAIGVSATALYNKLDRVETGVSAALVRDSAALAEPVVKALRASQPRWLPGYQIKVRDARASAAQLARLYGKRWSIETAFCEITTTLSCEINTLGYPTAALFTFCLALLAYNAVSLIKAALRSAHGRQKVNDEVSSYALSLEISRTYDGMMIAIPAPHWGLFRVLSDQAFANVLRELASSVNLARYQKHPRGPKKKPPARTTYQNGKHVSTAKLLAQR
jgi:hypothetical protein